MSQSTILLGSGSQVLLQIQSEGNEELKSKGRKGGTGLGQVNAYIQSTGYCWRTLTNMVGFPLSTA